MKNNDKTEKTKEEDQGEYQEREEAGDLHRVRGFSDTNSAPMSAGNDISEEDESEDLSFSEVKRNWVKEHLRPFEKYPDISPYASKKRLFAGYNALFARLNPGPDNEH